MRENLPALPLVLVPELFRQAGGVQRYSIRFIEALDRIYGARVPVLSMNDRSGDFPPGFLEGRVAEGCGDCGSVRRKLRFIARTLRANPPAIFSTHPGPAPWLAVLKRLTGVPYLCVTHGIDAWSLTRIQSGAIGRSDLVLPVSRFTGNRLAEQLGDDPPPFAILPNMVEEERFFPALPAVDWRARLSIPPSSRVMLTVCRLSTTETGKGYDLVLEALPRLTRDHPSLAWILAGKGDDLSRIREKARSLGVEDHCRFPGFIEDSELPDLYRSSDLFVLPSRKEGFGIVFLEAAASGLPVIAGNRDGSVDALADGELGRLIDPESEEELLAAIGSLLENDSRSPSSLHHSCVGRFGRRAFENRLRDILAEHPRLAGAPLAGNVPGEPAPSS